MEESNNNPKNLNQNLNQNLDKFITTENKDQNVDSNSSNIKTDKSLVERINKKIITEDGRQLLF